MHLPSRSEPLPRVDEHLVEPEVTRDEMVRGVRMVAQPANLPHARCHNRLSAVVEANIAEGYIASSDLLTRVGPGSDFATDVCVCREGIDPTTGARYLEELAFEIVSQQSMRHITVRAEDLAKRGVRRVIAILLKKQEVREWSRELGGWITLDLDGVIEDPTLIRPIPVRALLESKAAKHAAFDAYANEKAIAVACELLGIPFGPPQQAQLDGLDAAALDRVLDRLRTERRWPLE
jgi:hypothetical protein